MPTSPRLVPLLPLRDIVVFPHMVVPLFVGREKSISALEEAMAKGGSREIFLSAQRKAKTNEPGPDDLPAPTAGNGPREALSRWTRPAPTSAAVKHGTTPS